MRFSIPKKPEKEGFSISQQSWNWTTMRELRAKSSHSRVFSLFCISYRLRYKFSWEKFSNCVTLENYGTFPFTFWTDFQYLCGHTYVYAYVCSYVYLQHPNTTKPFQQEGDLQTRDDNLNSQRTVDKYSPTASWCRARHSYLSEQSKGTGTILGP